MIPRPDTAGLNRESVWSYPRPAIAESCAVHLMIKHRGVIVADTRRSIRTLETSHPPSYYVPPDAIARGVLRRAEGSSLCEWKGAAVYWDVLIDDLVVPRAGWSYPDPSPRFAMLRDHHVAFYAAPFDCCSIDGETVVPQPGQFYGGWITSGVVGPFKGVPGSAHW
jgi:uncharacterized protein (DUF427 family)